MLAGTAATLCLTAAPLRAKTPVGLYASARRDKQGQNFAVIFSLDKGELTSLPLPGRAHQIAPHPLKMECVAIGRRPSRSCVVFGPKRQPFWFHARDDRHFQGHGIFSPNGQLFYTTENDYEGERGVIAIRDVANNYKQVGEFPSHGIGAHELSLTDKGQTLVIANGGILTHPDMGRQKLNLDVMAPSLVYMNAKSGALLEKHTLPPKLHQLSIRHLAIAPDGTVVFGCQYKGPKNVHPPLMGFHKRGEQIEMGKAPENLQRALRNYIGSVAIDSSGYFAAASAPRGNLVTFWDLRKRALCAAKPHEQQPLKGLSSGTGHTPLKDGCGVTQSGKYGGFVLTSGLGDIGTYTLNDTLFTRSPHSLLNKVQWDNHLSRLR